MKYNTYCYHQYSLLNIDAVQCFIIGTYDAQKWKGHHMNKSEILVFYFAILKFKSITFTISNGIFQKSYKTIKLSPKKQNN